MGINHEERIIEEYLHHMFANMDLQQALNSLRMIRRFRKKDVINALLRDTIIAYSRAFTACRGKRTLSEKLVPGNLRTLHREILNDRQKIIAHTDLEEKNARLSRFKFKSGCIYPFSFKPYSPFERFGPNIQRIQTLINEIRKNIENKTEDIEREHFDKWVEPISKLKDAV